MNVFKRTKKKAWSNFGLRCKDYCAGCIICEAYRHLDQFGGFPESYEALSEFAKEQKVESIK